MVCLVMLGAASFAYGATSQAKSTAPHYTRIFYYREGPKARASFLDHPSAIDVFAPQAYSLDDAGLLTGRIQPDLLAFARVNNIKVMPLVVNTGFSQQQGHDFLEDPAAETAAINALVAEGEKQGYWGWQFDFEQIDASHRDAYSVFIKQASDVFHQHGLIVSVAVVAQISENPTDYKESLWQNVIGVYDYAALATSTDFVTVMAYDDPESKGPIARLPWLKQVIEFSLSKIPPEKISLGVAFYSWTWSDKTGKLVHIGGYTGIHTVLQKYGVASHFSARHQAPYIEYTSKKRRYTIWYENSRSIKQKISLIRANKLAGFSAWALGLEVPGVWGAVK